MSNLAVVVVRKKSLAKGLVAGLIGGLAGTVAKTFAERVFPPHARGELGPPEQAAERVAGHALTPTANAIAAESIHWGFGAAAGAAYGALVEFYPAASVKEGAGFGMALQSLTQEGTLPALGLSAEPDDRTIRDRASETTAHVVYGVTTEMVRRFVRRFL